MYSLKNLKISAKGGSESAVFMIKHWHKITKSNAIEINPHLKIWLKDRTSRVYFYKCDQLSVKNTCLVHEITPNVCKGYPFYGKEKLRTTETFYTPECGFNRDDLKEIQK